MKLKRTLAASLFAAMTSIAFNVNAAADTPPAAKAAPDASAPAMAEKAVHQMKIRPHSHVEEKTGIAQRSPAAKPARPDAARDMSKHFHPRDGK